MSPIRLNAMLQVPCARHLERTFRTGIMLVLAGLLMACQTVAPRPVVSHDEIVQWSKDGKSGGEIIALLEDRRLPAHLTGSQLGKLKEQGVPDEVLDYMLSDQTRRIRYQSRLEAEPYWWSHPYFYYRPYRVIVVEQPRK